MALGSFDLRVGGLRCCARILRSCLKRVRLLALRLKAGGRRGGDEGAKITIERGRKELGKASMLPTSQLN